MPIDAIGSSPDPTLRPAIRAHRPAPAVEIDKTGDDPGLGQESPALKAMHAGSSIEGEVTRRIRATAATSAGSTATTAAPLDPPHSTRHVNTTRGIAPEGTPATGTRANDASSPPSEERAPLSVGSRGAEVKELQQLLKIKDDGIFGQGTKKAVQKFQQANGLAGESGVVDDKTWSALERTRDAGPASKSQPAVEAGTAPLPGASNKEKLDYATRLAKSMGLRITSSYREGEKSMHGKGRAIDVQDPATRAKYSAKLEKFYHEMAKLDPSQLIYDHIGTMGTKMQKRIGEYDGNHYNHVHVAF